MGTLAEYLAEKGRALTERIARISRGEAGPQKIRAKVSAEGRSGVRRIRIRDHQVLSDSPRDFAGFDLGPTSSELQLGVLGSSLTHIVLVQAAVRQVPIEEVDVEVDAVMDPRAGQTGYEQVPYAPHQIVARVTVVSTAPRADVQALFEAAEKTCPILNLLGGHAAVQTELKHIEPGSVAYVDSYAMLT